MSKITSNYPGLLEPLAELVGVDLSSVKRIVIDIKSGDIPIVHVEQYGDERLLRVVSALTEVQIERG